MKSGGCCRVGIVKGAGLEDEQEVRSGMNGPAKAEQAHEHELVVEAQ